MRNAIKFASADQVLRRRAGYCMFRVTVIRRSTSSCGGARATGVCVIAVGKSLSGFQSHLLNK